MFGLCSKNHAQILTIGSSNLLQPASVRGGRGCSNDDIRGYYTPLLRFKVNKNFYKLGLTNEKDAGVLLIWLLEVNYRHLAAQNCEFERNLDHAKLKQSGA